MEPESAVPKRQQRKACDTCRNRKIRCDITSRAEAKCSACERAGIECLSTTKWAQPRRHRARAKVFPTEQPMEAESQNDPPSTIISPDVTDSVSPLNAANLVPRDGISSLLAAAQTSPQDSVASAAGSGTAPKDSDAILRREHLARSGLATFFKHGIGAGVWPYFDTPDSFRITYLGTSVSNLYHLVDLHQGATTRPISPTEGVGNVVFDPGTTGSGLGAGPAPSGTQFDKENRKILHYPYPPIRPSRPWRPDPEMWCFSSAQDIATDVSSFPAPDVRDALVAAYFEHIHPMLPVVSMPEFLNMYHSRDKPPPLLLFQAVLMAGAHACDHPLVVEDRHTVKSVLFRRASLLYHVRHESDRIHMMQAATLFTWHIGDGDTVTGGPWYWSGIATRIGSGLGTHRRGTMLPALEISQYKRSWWASFVAEVMACLETGRPCTIRAEDIDQLMLTDDDMIDTPGLSASPTQIGNSNLWVNPNPMSTNSHFLNHMVELAYIGLDIMSASTPSQDRIVDYDAINTRLGRWALRSGISSSAGEETAMTFHLRMHYHLVLLHLYRKFDNVDSHSVRSTAAQSIILSLEKLSELGCLCQCHFTGVSAILAAGIELANQLRAATEAGTLLLVIHALDQLSRLLQCATLLAKYWPNAEAAHTVFQDIHKKYASYAEQGVQGERINVPESQPDWNRLFNVAYASQLNNLSIDQDWLNMSTWPSLP